MGLYDLHIYMNNIYYYHFGLRKVALVSDIWEVYIGGRLFNFNFGLMKIIYLFLNFLAVKFQQICHCRCLVICRDIVIITTLIYLKLYISVSESNECEVGGR